MPILKIPKGKNDPDREMKFELDYQKSLTSEQRYKMMIDRSREILQRLITHGYKRPFEVIKRK